MEFILTVQLDVSPLRVVNEGDIELNTRREIPYLPVTMSYFVIK